MREELPYNPLDKIHLGESIADELIARPLEALPPPEKFLGAGVYAIYYHGDFEPYSKIALESKKSRFEIPIYVGKASPEGVRKGVLLERYTGTALYDRLNEHARSVANASNLRSEHFSCRYLVLEDIWIPLAETLLISRFAPVWNVVIDGFGIHDPGAGRREGKLSAWDVLHPGRGWVSKQKPGSKTSSELLEAILQHTQRY